MWMDEGAKQRWLRIRIAVAAYAYEMKDDPIITDAEFDNLTRQVDISIPTSYILKDNSEIDQWFKDNFNPSTGSWVHNHPDIDGLSRIYRYIKKC